jgi:4'-phosphopantetheinyl transferase
VPAPVIDIWCCPSDGVGEEGPPSLPVLPDKDEQARQAAFATPDLRAQFAWRRWRLREILASYTGAMPGDLVLSASEDGKPYLREARDRLSFNLSHKDGLMVVAVAPGIPVGVDVERLETSVDAMALARRFFVPDETEALSDLSGEAQRRAFLACWTRKEAVMKAHGAGMRLGLRSLSVGFAPHAESGLAVTAGGRHFVVKDLELDGRYTGAIAVEADDFRIELKT